MYFQMAKSILLVERQVRLVALEGAIVVAIDSANMLNREKIAHVAKMSTSSVEVCLIEGLCIITLKLY